MIEVRSFGHVKADCSVSDIAVPTGGLSVPLVRAYAVLLVLTMQTVYVKLVTIRLDIILNALLLIVGVLIILKNRNIRYSRHVLGVVALWVILFVSIPLAHLVFLNNQGINLPGLMLVTVLCSAVLVISTCVLLLRGIIRFLEDVSCVIFWLTAVTLVLYFIGQVFHLVHPTGTVTINWGGVRSIDSYFYLVFVPQGLPYHSFENGRFSGIFAEAPMCAFMLCFALIVMLFVSRKQIKPFRIAILIAAVYATASTTGYIVALFSVGMYAMQKLMLNTRLRGLRFLLIGIIVPALVLIALAMYGDKLELDVGSVSVRSSNFAGALADFAESPIFGHGFKSDSIGLTGGNTSVYSNVIQQGGLLFAVWYFLPIAIALFRFAEMGKWRLCVAVVLYLVLLYSTVVTYTALSVTMIACFLVIAFANRSESRTTSSQRNQRKYYARETQ